MPADLPIELLRRILLLIDEQRTLHALSCTSRYVHAETELLLYENVTLKSHGEHSCKVLTPRLQRFLETVEHSERLSNLVQSLEVAVQQIVIPSSFIRLVGTIAQRLGCLNSFLFENSEHQATILFPVLHNRATTRSLKKFSYFTEIYDSIPIMAFLETQNDLEHLHLPQLWAPTPPLRHGSLPNLRVLNTNLTVVLNLLVDRSITHVRVHDRGIMDLAASFSAQSLVKHAQTTTVLSIRADESYEAVFSLANIMQNLRYLEVSHFDSKSEDLITYIDRLQSTHLRYLRITSLHHESPLFVSRMFERFSSLKGVDFQMTVDHLYHRWHRDAAHPVAIAPIHAPREAWWRDWERDYQLVAVTDSKVAGGTV